MKIGSFVVTNYFSVVLFRVGVVTIAKSFPLNWQQLNILPIVSQYEGTMQNQVQPERTM